jgi:glycosyltransferase involved in cell wall biosynthesis
MPRKVLWLIKGLGLGGAERLLTLAADHVDRTRYVYEAAYLLPWKTALVNEMERAGVPTVCLNQSRPYDPRIVGRIVRLVRERRVDILHMHLPYAAIVGRIAGKLAGVPAMVYTEHGLQERCHPLTRIANQLTMRLGDVTIAVSGEVKDSLLRSRLVRGTRVLTIRNGVDVEWLRRMTSGASGIRGEFSIPEDGLVVGVVTAFRPQKQLETWIRAARAIADAEPRTTFIVVGHGPSQPAVRQLADRIGLNGRITFTGLRHDAARLMAGFDVFMSSSIYEGLPVSVLEAMALERPIVATRVGGLPGILRDGQEGFLVQPGDPGALAERVLTLLRNPSLRRTVGEAARRRVETEFSIQRMVRETEAVYAELLEAKAPSGKLESRESPAS